MVLEPKCKLWNLRCVRSFSGHCFCIWRMEVIPVHSWWPLVKCLVCYFLFAEFILLILWSVRSLICFWGKGPENSSVNITCYCSSTLLPSSFVLLIKGLDCSEYKLHFTTGICCVAESIRGIPVVCRITPHLWTQPSSTLCFFVWPSLIFKELCKLETTVLKHINSISEKFYA